MSKRLSILIASAFAIIGTNALADGPPKGKSSMAEICPAKSYLSMRPEANDLVIRIPPNVGPSEEELAKVAEQQRQCMEWQRKLAGVPRQAWDKMQDAEKAEAVESARAARLKAGGSPK